ncbi:MAG TPA: polyamine ABC transporter ATP-binding protein [Ilumatobacter sp.]|nr:polyamine ABC transporter ATP-binding protein [Ilumatobacter sp.]
MSLDNGVGAAGSSGDAVVVLQNVRKQFGDYVAVEHADFAIKRGEFFSLLGPSGCGKTTLLKMIAGFEQPTQGAVLLEGADVSSVPPYKRNVNTVFQQYALFPHMSIVDNVAFGLRSKKVPAAEARTRSLEMLEIVKLAEFAHRRPNQLSGGQQQRVALARALVNLPAALLLDEPLAALDLKLREAMQLELKRIQREVGITFVFVTHDQGEALTMSDRIAVMSRGRVEQIGTPSEIYDQPASIFVAGFIGSANLLPGRVSRDTSSPKVDLSIGATIDVPATAGIEGGGDVTVVMRPERLRPYTGDPQPGRTFVGTIKELIYQGNEIKLIVMLDDATEIIVTIDPDEATAATTPGNLITLTWAPTAPFVIEGRTAIVGATSTDFDEVEATMAGELDADDDVDDGSGQPAGGAAAEPPSQIGRRALIGAAGLGGAAALIGAVFAFSGGGEGDSDNAGDGDTPGFGNGSSTLGSGASQVRVLNWQAYIDPTEDGEIGTLDRFRADSGISIEYSENFNDNNEVYARELSPYLSEGDATAWDIVCPTYWMASRLKARGWLEPLPVDLIPNRVNLESRFVTEPWDFGAIYNLPWQAGTTGLAYVPEKTGRELGSIMDLFDPEFRGRVALLTEMRDTIGLIMLGLGHDPSVPNIDGALEAIEFLEQQKASRQIRAFTGNEYMDDLLNGNLVACVGWSGDILQLQYEMDIEYVVPEEGAISWYDTMVIPKGAANGVAAAEWMNFVYDPVQAAQLTYWVQYMSPVKGVRDELSNMGGDAAELAESPILFPDEATAARLHGFASLSDDDEDTLNTAFQRLMGN